MVFHPLATAVCLVSTLQNSDSDEKAGAAAIVGAEVHSKRSASVCDPHVFEAGLHTKHAAQPRFSVPAHTRKVVLLTKLLQSSTHAVVFREVFNFVILMPHPHAIYRLPLQVSCKSRGVARIFPDTHALLCEAANVFW